MGSEGWRLQGKMTDGDTYSKGEEGIRGDRAGPEGQEGKLEDWTYQITGSPLV